MDQKTIDLSRATAQAAGLAAAQALGEAATNASKKGGTSSEFKATIFGILVAGAVAGLHVLAVIPSPVMPIALALTAGLTASAYSLSRGQVKKAALDGAAAVAGSLLPQQAATIEASRTIASVALGVDPAKPAPANLAAAAPPKP
jgi:hypothetical protein